MSVVFGLAIACAGCTSVSPADQAAQSVGLSDVPAAAFPDFSTLPPVPRAPSGPTQAEQMDAQLIARRLAELEGAPLAMTGDAAFAMLMQWVGPAKSWLTDPRAEPPAITGALTEAWAKEQRTLTTKAGEPY